MASTVAHHTSEGVLCLNPICEAYCIDLLIEGAVPMTQADIGEEQDNHEGRSVCCISCSEPLDLWTLTNGAQS